jgi:hypothetical protein
VIDKNVAQKIVEACFEILHKSEHITHGIKIELLDLGGDKVFEVRGPSGGVSLGFVYYLKTDPPGAYPKSSAITNCVPVSAIENEQSIFETMARDMCRISGFVAALTDGWTQPTISNLDGGDLGLPHRLSRAEMIPEPPAPGSYGALKREDYPEIKTAPKDSAGKTFADIFREDFEKKHPIRDVVAEALHTGIEEVHAVIDKALRVCECGAQVTGQPSHSSWCPAGGK